MRQPADRPRGPRARVLALLLVLSLAGVACDASVPETAAPTGSRSPAVVATPSPPDASAGPSTTPSGRRRSSPPTHG